MLSVTAVIDMYVEFNFLYYLYSVLKRRFSFRVVLIHDNSKF